MQMQQQICKPKVRFFVLQSLGNNTLRLTNYVKSIDKLEITTLEQWFLQAIYYLQPMPSSLLLPALLLAPWLRLVSLSPHYPCCGHANWR